MMPFFTRSLTLVPRSLLLNCTETLATHARFPPFKLSTCAYLAALFCVVILRAKQCAI